MSSPDPEWSIGPTQWRVGDSGPLHVAVLFVDLVSSTDLAHALGLEEYAEFSRAFTTLCTRQTQHLFGVYHEGRYRHDGRHYSCRIQGDEMLVCLHTGRQRDDVYQLVCLAQALKCAWLGTPINAARVASGRAAHELACGIHAGPVWATRTEDGFELSGFAINLAKRVESVSRSGERFRIFVSDAAFKLVNRRMRNLLFGARRMFALKGIADEVGVTELVESFADPVKRMPGDLAKSFSEVAQRALQTNTFDLWVHSCLMVSEGARAAPLGREALERCQRILNIDPHNAVALLYAAEAEQALGNLEEAQLHLEDLTRFWPTFGDGWLALARLLKERGDLPAARRSVLQARRNGVAEEEEPLP